MARDLPKGDIPTLVLATLDGAARHGYAIAREVERLSENALLLREGSLYPALRVLEQDGLVTSEWTTPPGGGQSRRVYTLTDAGRIELQKRAGEWHAYARVMGTILGARGRKSDEPQA